MMFGVTHKVTNYLLNKGFHWSYIYKFAIVVIFGSLVSLFFNPMQGIPSQDLVLYLQILAATLCMLLLLSDLWVDSRGVLIRLLWYSIIFVYLPFSTTFTMVRSDFYYSWILVFAISTVLLFLITDFITFLFIFIPAFILSYLAAFSINQYYPPYPSVPHHSFDINFALYWGVFLLLLMALYFHNKLYVQKHLYKYVESKVMQRTRDLHRAVEIKNEFLDNISHEIRTPVHNILSITSELYDQWDNFSDYEKKDLVLTLKKCENKLLTLCTDILDFSQYKNGESNLNIKKCNLKKLISDLIKSEFRLNSNIFLESQVFKEDEVIECDHSKIIQVIRNLLNNAVKYGGGSKVLVTISKRDASICVSVSDLGHGIPESELDSIFLPFEQSSRTKTKAGGTGLGLAISQEIVKSHSGKIWAENNQNGGAMFNFIIPIKNRG